MEILYLLVPVSVSLVLAIGAVFWFALTSGQFDDLDGPGVRVLADDDLPPKPEDRFDVDQKRGRTGGYDGTQARRGAAEARGETDAGAGNV